MNLPEATVQLSSVVLVEVSFAHRNDPLSMLPNTPLPTTQITINVSNTAFNENGAMGLRLSLSSDTSDTAALYDFRLTMAALLIRTETTPAEWTERQFAEIGVTMLVPFVREALASVTGRGRFGPVLLNPLNIRALFETIDEQNRAKVEAGERESA
jgi:preprotein translocase subunit SecB